MIMIMAIACRFPGWPIEPVYKAGTMAGILAIAGVIFSLAMLIDCLKRKPSEFSNPLTKNGEYDKLIWAAGIVLSLLVYCLGAIAYFFVVKRAKQEKSE